MTHVNDMTVEEYEAHLDNGYDDVRYDQIQRFTDKMIALMVSEVEERGGCGVGVYDILYSREGVAMLQDVFHHALSDVREVVV